MWSVIRKLIKVMSQKEAGLLDLCLALYEVFFLIFLAMILQLKPIFG